MKSEGRRLSSKRAKIGLLALAIAVLSVSDGRDGRVAYAQGNVDPTVAKARAEMNRGRYEEAENILKPAALKAPTGDSALELGLLYQMLGRRAEAQALLDPIANLAVGPRTTGAEYARLGREFAVAAHQNEGNSGFRIIPAGADGFLVRMQMINAAERTPHPTRVSDARCFSIASETLTGA